MTAPVSAETFASRTSSREWPAEVQAVMDGIAARLSWPSMHWGTEDVHPDAWPHVAAAALDAARAAVRADLVAEALAPIRALVDAAEQVADGEHPEGNGIYREFIGTQHWGVVTHDRLRAALPAPVQAAERTTAHGHPIADESEGQCAWKHLRFGRCHLVPHPAGTRHFIEYPFDSGRWIGFDDEQAAEEVGGE